MRVSVVINTYNRGNSLRNTLASFAYQTYSDFEVVVVNGPSTDESDDVIAEFSDSVRAYSCPEAHLSKSRNIGIAHASGDIVAFIDDDAIPEPDWIAGLVKAYDSADIGGVGGIVYDHTGVSYQYLYSVCSRIATTRFDIKPPFDANNRPGADPFVYLQGTNCSYRRDVLVEIGGFNEEIEYYLDEVEVCMRAIDAGYQMVPLAHAAVHHKYLPSHIRDQKRVVFDPFSTVKNHCTFAVRNGTKTRPQSEVFEEITRYVGIVKAGGRANFDAGRLTAVQLEHYLRRTERAMDIGVRQGLTKPRPIRHLPAARPEEFLAYPILTPAGGRMKVGFVTREFPPGCGGVGRFMCDLAKGFAAQGHQIHVITHSESGKHTVDFEDGVWMHRLPDSAPKGDDLRAMPLCHNYTHVANVYHEISRIHDLHGLDVVTGPIWLCEGAIAQLDDRWPTVLALQTSMKTIAELGGTNSDPALVRDMIALETATVQRSQNIHAISHAILEKARADFGSTKAAEHVVHIGTRDVRDQFPRQRSTTGRTRILFVGRIETRKGIDVLLQAAYRVLPEFPNAELVLVGKYNPSGNDNAMSSHEAIMATSPDLSSRIVFAGEATDDELMQNYADADIVVLPSRYESFGLVLTEGMMFGKPVVASRVGGMVEIVVDGENGYLAESQDPESFATAFRKLLSSAELREQFGRRSRERFEERFSTDVMVANTIACYRGIANQWKAKGPGRSSEPNAVKERLISLIAEVSKVPEPMAREAARELLSKQFRTGVDMVVELNRIWHRTNEEFIRGLYDLILRRPADAVGLQWHTAQLDRGCSRRDIIESLLYCNEARIRNTDTTWFADFIAPPTLPQAVLPTPVIAVAVVRISMKQRLRSIAKKARTKILSTPGLGRGLRLMKHTVVMPRTVRLMTNQTAELAAVVQSIHTQLEINQQPALRQIRDMQKELSERIASLEAKTMARDRQVQWVLSQQAEMLDNFLADQEQMQQPRPRNSAAA